MGCGVWSGLNTHLDLVFGALAQVVHKLPFTQGRYEERVVPYAYLQPVERGGGRRQGATGAANGSYGVDVVALGREQRHLHHESPSRFESSLRNIFTQAASKNYFFEKMPNVGNPLGLSNRSAPLADKIKNLLIEDFLGYMVSNHSIYPSAWDEQQKKNFLIKLPKTD